MALWHKWLDTPFPPLGSWVRVSVTPCGFCDGWNRVWVGFSWGFSHFPLLQISFLHTHRIHFFHFIHACYGVSGMVSQHCYSLIFNVGASSHLIPRPGPLSDTSSGYYYFLQEMGSIAKVTMCLSILAVERFLLCTVQINK